MSVRFWPVSAQADWLQWVVNAQSRMAANDPLQPLMENSDNSCRRFVL